MTLFEGFNLDPDTASALLEATGFGTRPAGAGCETFPRLMPVAAATITSTKAQYTAVVLRKGTVVSNITFWSHSTAGVALLHQVAGLYDANKKLVAQSADKTSDAWAANTAKTFAMTAAYTVPEDGIYYVGIAMSATTTIPTLIGLTAVVNAHVDAAPAVAFTDTANAITATFPATATDSAGAVPLYAYVS